jgi:hypothetical protein
MPASGELEDIITGIFAFLGVILLVIAAVTVTILIFYYRAVLRLIDGIRDGIIRNVLFPLPSVTAFIVFMSIFTGFTVIAALGGSVTIGVANEMVSGFIGDLLSVFPGELLEILNIDQFADSPFGSPLKALLPLVKSAGIIMLLVALGQFNNKLKIAMYNLYSDSADQSATIQ